MLHNFVILFFLKKQEHAPTRPVFKLVVSGVNDDRGFQWMACAAYRIPVGGKTAIPSELVAPVTFNGVIQDFWSHATVSHRLSKIMEDLTDQSVTATG